MLSDKLDHYRLVEKIGSGGMGEVYRAHDEYLDRDVALKVLPAGTLADEAARKLFRKEALAIARLNHPNIATVHEFNCKDGVDFLAMELIQGKSLREILKDGPLQEKEIRRLGLQLAEALTSAHEHGVVHRDLKPANMMITRDGRLKILDFGLAKLVQSMGTDLTLSSTGTESVPGTVPYMAPEVLRGEVSDTRADVFAAGAVLYEMATGKRAFAESNWPRLIDSILNQAPKPPREFNPEISTRMQATILKALEKDPQKRHQSATELLLELEAPASSNVDSKSAVSVEQSQTVPLEIAHVLFMDIVAYSMLPMDQQRRRLRELQKTVLDSSEFNRAKSTNQLISLPTGDGMALVFFGDPEYPVRCALELSRSLQNNPAIRLRMGIHTGPVYRVADINAESNVSGGGINMAQRVMDCGDAGHILLSKTVVDVLGQLSCWDCTLHDLGETEVKHGVRVHLFNFYTNDLGNSKIPNKLRATKGLRKSGIQGGKRTKSSDSELATPQRPRSASKSAPKIPPRPESAQTLGAAPTERKALSDIARRWWILGVACIVVLGVGGFAISPIRKWRLNIRSGGNNPPSAVASKDEAIEALKKATLINPNSLVNQNELGKAYLQSGDYQKALACFNQMTSIDPNNYLGHMNKAVAYFDLARYDESIVEFRKTLNLQPNADVYSNLGTASFYLKRYADAINFSERAAEMHPNDEVVVGNLADAYFWSGQKKKAMDDYDRAIDLATKALGDNPKDANVLGDLARYYAKKGEIQLADYYITQAQLDRPSDPFLIYEEAVVKAATGRQKQAIPLLRSAFEKGVSPEMAKLDPEFGTLKGSPEFEQLVNGFSRKSN
jgi:serine/threonine protein kinase/tetratricopeptide (TPR) repeat protein